MVFLESIHMQDLKYPGLALWLLFYILLFAYTYVKLIYNDFGFSWQTKLPTGCRSLHFYQQATSDFQKKHGKLFKQMSFDRLLNILSVIIGLLK